MNALPKLIRHHLNLDVSRLLDILLDVNSAVVESRRSLGGRRLERSPQLVLGTHDAHAAPAAAGRSLYDDGVTNLAREPESFFFRSDTVRASRHDRQPRFMHRATRFDLVAHEANHVCRWSDELDVAGFADLSDVSRFGEKPVAGMNRIDVENLCGADDGGNVEIALRGRSGPNARGLVGEADVQRITIDVAMNGD